MTFVSVAENRQKWDLATVYEKFLFTVNTHEEIKWDTGTLQKM